jgi:V/A-type H+-transporting ATPase subunit B
MKARAFQKIYCRLANITKATCTLEVSGVGYEEMAWVQGRAAQVVKIVGNKVTLQVFEGTEGLRSDAEVVFTGRPPWLPLSDYMNGRFFDAFGNPIDGLPAVEGREYPIGGPSVNPVRRMQPSELIATGIAGIDLNNTLVSGQKIPFFADPDQPYNQVLALIALRAQVDKIILGGMGLTRDDYLFFKHAFEKGYGQSKIIGFINTTDKSPVERLLIPDMALSAAEYFATEKNEKVLVLLTDMTQYANALSIVSNRMDQIPSKDSMPGSLYSDLAKIYEKAVQFPDGGNITILAVTTLSGGDITHAIPDNTGYITEGQLFLRRSPEVNKVIIDPFRSLSRLKQLVIGKATRSDHPQVMNAAIRLYADAANSRTKLENGFELSDYDKRVLHFAEEYSRNILAIDVNLGMDEMLDETWRLFGQYMTRDEVGIKQEFVDRFWKEPELI